jgi:hypothetical protein
LIRELLLDRIEQGALHDRRLLAGHPKIPFLADKYRDKSGDFVTGKIFVIAAD